LKKDLKDWQIAQIMWGKNTKVECKIIASLRKYGVIEPLCEGWCTIRDSRKEDDGGWLIPIECLEQVELIK